MHLITRLGLAAAIGLAGSLTLAQTVSSKPEAKTVKTAKASPTHKPAKASASRQQLDSKAKGLALATTVVESISETQLTIASRVLTGKADCDAHQTVSVDPVQEHPGHFRVSYKNDSYTMVPEETSTGAVRLVDRRAGVIWLQIPAKSMMMNSRIGQRVVDGCMHAEQRAAVNAVRAAAQHN